MHSLASLLIVPYGGGYPVFLLLCNWEIGPKKAKRGKNPWFYMHDNTKGKIHNNTCARQTWAVAPRQSQRGFVYPRTSRILPCLYLQGAAQDKEPHSIQQELLQPLPSAWGHFIFLKLAKNFPSQSLGGRLSFHWSFQMYSPTHIGAFPLVQNHSLLSQEPVIQRAVDRNTEMPLTHRTIQWAIIDQSAPEVLPARALWNGIWTSDLNN